MPSISVAQTVVDFGADFRALWDKVKKHIPAEKDYPAPQPSPTAEPISTQEFFGLTPDQITYFWKPNSSIRLSSELTAWTRELRAELDSTAEEISLEKFLKTLVNAITATNCVFFHDMFYEFIARQHKQKV